MRNNILVIGGCRSGKSRHALKLAEEIPGQNRFFIATLTPWDNEMKDRVRRHQAERDTAWQTIEEPLDLPNILMEKGPQADVILVDCLTLWINNLLAEKADPNQLAIRFQELADTLHDMTCPVVLVTNEVGTGIVPENRLARLFRDQAGFCNQVMAAACDRVIWMVAGLPVKVK
jgi:adenosylcobinamide kinase/adenosylcobinamide-phosphate guanylyltransferase